MNTKPPTNMLDPKELRIGNYLTIWYLDAPPGNIEVTSPLLVNHCMPGNKMWERLAPIPLTWRLFKKMKFTKGEERGYTHFYPPEGIWSVRLDNEKEKIYRCIIHVSPGETLSLGAPIQYLHQLQNAIYFITGKDAEIELL